MPDDDWLWDDDYWDEEGGEGCETTITDLFALGDELSLPKLGCALLGFIAFTVSFEVGLFKLESTLADRPAYLEMLKKVYKELMILGFVSFFTTLLQQLDVIKEGKWFEAVEIAHLIMFFVGIAIVLEALFLSKISRLITNRWDVLDVTPVDQIADRVAAIEGRRRGLQWLRFRLSPSYEAAEYHLVKSLFLRHNGLPASFEYRTYLRQSLMKHVVDVTEISISSWFFLMAVFALMTGSYYVIGHVGDGLWVVIVGGVCISGGLFALLLSSLHALTRAARFAMRERDNESVADAMAWLRDHPIESESAQDLDALRESVAASQGHHQHNPLDDDVVNLLSSIGKKAKQAAVSALRPSHDSDVELVLSNSHEDSSHNPGGVDLDSLFVGSSAMFKRSLDFLLLSLSFLVGLLVVHYLMLVINEYFAPALILFLLFAPPVASLLIFTPVILRNWALVTTAGECDHELLAQVLELQQEMSELKGDMMQRFLLLVPPPHSDDAAARVFAILDANASGRLSHSELRRGLRKNKIFLSKTKFRNLLRAVDPEHKGWLSVEDFSAAMSVSVSS